MNIITGKVVKGRGLGKKMGFPTLNIPYEGELEGVFAGKVFLNGQWHKAAVHFGKRSISADKDAVCEAFLLEWEGEIDPDTELKIEILDKIRDTKKFSGIDDLKKQIAKDVEFARMALC